MKRIAGISGGIGSGKSVVARIMRVMGYPVYDCDAEARRIMDTDTDIHERLCGDIHPRAVVDGCVDRALISTTVFADPDALARLNAIVHRAVIDDFTRWAARQCAPLVFVESAIMCASGLCDIIDIEWHVAAPLDVRVDRVARRSGLSGEEIRARIRAQEAERPRPDAVVIDNSPERAVLPQIHAALVMTLG